MSEELLPTATATTLPAKTESPEIDSPLNTPNTLGVTPRYVLQHNAISRSIHKLSATAQKLTAMAMSMIPSDFSSRSVAFTFTEFCKAVGYDKGGESFKVFHSAINECMKNSISIETINPKSGKKEWETYTWFSYSKLSEETGVAIMTFSQEFAKVLLDLKRAYAKIDLKDIGELQGKYALRIFELATSYSSLKGKDGNKEKTWYFERSVPDIRLMLGVPEDTYPETKRFRQKVVEEPVKEINNAGIGLKITPQGIKQGRKLAAIRFDCEQSPRTVQKKEKGSKSKKKDSVKLELPGENPKTAHEKTEKEYLHLKELYPEEFVKLYREELARDSFMPSTSGFRKQAAEATALCLLREKYGIVK
jgi:plasmid replication initiation protein